MLSVDLLYSCRLKCWIFHIHVDNGVDLSVELCVHLSDGQLSVVLSVDLVYSCRLKCWIFHIHVDNGVHLSVELCVHLCNGQLSGDLRVSLRVQLTH